MLREEHGLRMSENKMLMRLQGLKEGQEAEGITQ
jgi:hypothetical protein